MAYLIFVKEIWDIWAQTLCPSVTVFPLPNINERYCVIMKISEDKLLSKLYWSVAKSLKTMCSQLYTCNIETDSLTSESFDGKKTQLASKSMSVLMSFRYRPH